MPCSASRRRTSAWSCRISRAGGVHGGGLLRRVKRAINSASIRSVLLRASCVRAYAWMIAGIHDTDDVPGIVQPDRQRLAIGAGRLESSHGRASPAAAAATRRGPQIPPACSRSFCAGSCHPAAAARREFGFGDIDPQHGVHLSLLSVASCAVSLVHASWARREPLSIPFDRTPHAERRVLISVTGSHGLSHRTASRRSYSGVPE